MPRKMGDYPPLSRKAVRAGGKSRQQRAGDPVERRGLVIASVQTYFPHMKFGTDPELTGFENHRDEWV